jgi:formylglycine-generating enzyme required for sulfatase activity
MRLSVREFAAHLGVSDRTVSKWEAGADKVLPRPETQAILDTALARSTPDVQERFRRLADDERDEPDATPVDVWTPPRQVRHPVDGKLMLLIEASVFLAGRDREPMWLPGFYIDVMPTTNADYARFVAATGHRPPLHWEAGDYPAGLSDHPVVNVTYRDAQAYAAWARKALPTAAEWEKAARGTRGNVYPWGDRPAPAKCNVRETAVGRTTPVDKYHSGASAYGVYDLCGNAWEWCSTETEPGRFVLKGSAFTSSIERAAAAAMNDASADMLDDDTGFRTAAPADAVDRLLGR